MPVTTDPAQEPIVTEKANATGGEGTTAPIPNSAAPFPQADPPAEKWCKACGRTHPVADFIEPGTARQFDVCNAVRAERAAKRKQNAEIKRAVAEKIAADDAANPPPLEVVRNHPLWQAYRETIIALTEKLYDMPGGLDPEIPKFRIDAHLATIDKLTSEGITPETVRAYVDKRMRNNARQNKREIYRFEYLPGDINDVRMAKPVIVRAVTTLDWSTADGCIAIAENAQNAPETRVKALNKLRAYKTPWDVDSAQIERISAMLSRVSHGDLEQEMAA